MYNAVRYLGNTPKVIIVVVEQEKQLAISISDNGGGLPIAQTQLRFSDKSGMEIIDKIWGKNSSISSTSSLYTAVSSLRKALSYDRKVRLRTVRGIGYRLDIEV